jgi:2-keto-4-pentenoate hydratase/2-oxohepta-3-ene-1,7-dioic acid hydratase in catechol pathway
MMDIVPPMRRVRFRDRTGQVHTGEWTDEGIEFGGDIYDPANVEVLPPVEATKILGVGPNHITNVEGKEHYEYPDSPKDLYLFVKTAPNALLGHKHTAVLESGGEYIYELELGIVIGTECKDVSREDASEVIDGYTIVNEITNKAVPEGFEPTNAVRTKSFDNSAPTGPVVADPEHVPSDAEMEIQVNGQVEQFTDRSELIFPETVLIEEISSYLTLYPGDVIATGAPIGAEPLADGDDVRLKINGIGTLAHDVRIE